MSILFAGVIYKDFKLGQGQEPTDGEQVTFQYTAYNESGRLIDSTYRQDRPAETRLGISGLIPGLLFCH
jgi:FKBP-type peptidyl-prolyl cis-trans isomerase